MYSENDEDLMAAVQHIKAGADGTSVLRLAIDQQNIEIVTLLIKTYIHQVDISRIDNGQNIVQHAAAKFYSANDKDTAFKIFEIIIDNCRYSLRWMDSEAKIVNEVRGIMRQIVLEKGETRPHYWMPNPQPYKSLCKKRQSASQQENKGYLPYWLTTCLPTPVKQMIDDCIRPRQKLD